MISFLIGIAIGYFFRSLVALVFGLIADLWRRYQQVECSPASA